MKSKLFLIVFLSLSKLLYAQSPKINYGNNIDSGGYKNVNGIRMYYETYGSGRPLIFLHGNGGSIASARAKIDYYKNYFKVIAIDSRGHGKSIDSADLTYDQMAEDVAVLLDSLHIDSAYISGQSDGGIMGLLLAIHHPDKVAKLVTYGANLFPGKKAIVNEIEDWVRDTLKATTNKRTIQLFKLLEYQPHITVAQLKTIKCPVLIMSGDRDAIKLEHSLKIFYNIENSNFFVMPGATHFGSYQKPELYNMVMMDFLTKPFSKLSTADLMLPKK